MLAVAVVAWQWTTPDLGPGGSGMTLGWLGIIWLRNLVLLATVAGGLHLWLYVWRRQGDDLRFDARPLGTNKRRFLFHDQVRDNAFLSAARKTGGPPP